MRVGTWIVLATVTLNGVVSAAPTIVVGDHELQPNTPRQTIRLFVTGGDAVEGLNLNVQIADGGSAGGGTDVGPVFSDVDILTGTIFDSNNNGGDTLLAAPQFVAMSVLTGSGTVQADGLLATLTLDTTGVSSGSYALHLSDTLNGPTDFAGVPAQFQGEAGTLTIAPEPAGLAMLGVAGLMSITPRRRRR